MTTDIDRHLVMKVADGSEAAFGSLYERHRSVVLGYLIQLLRDRSEAEDVLQDVFLGAWQNAHRYYPERGSVRGWLFVMARSRALDRMRSSQARKKREAESGAYEIDGDSPSRDDQLIRDEALATLDEKQRACVELAFFAGCSQIQIADELEVPLGTVKSRFLAGMRRLRQRMTAS